MRRELIQTISAYNASARAYEETIGRLDNYDETYDFFAALLNPSAAVLDLACGSGCIGRRLKRSHPAVRITGVDLSPQMLGIAREALPDDEFLVADIVTYRAAQPCDAVVLGFAIPYLSHAEVRELIGNTRRNLRTGGALYLSFMDGTREGFETPSFNHQVKLYIYYHERERIARLLEQSRFSLVRQWVLDYAEEDGSVTKDVVIVAQKDGDD